MCWPLTPIGDSGARSYAATPTQPGGIPSRHRGGGFHRFSEAHRAMLEAVLAGYAPEAIRRMDAHVPESGHRRLPTPVALGNHP